MITIIILKSAINIVIASVKMMNKNKREKNFLFVREYVIYLSIATKMLLTC